MRNAEIVVSGSATTIVQQFLDLAGATWFDDPVDEATASALVAALKGRHRVEVFGQFKTLLREIDTERQCMECGSKLDVEFLPTFAAPSIPQNRSEFEQAVACMRRGPPMITERPRSRAA